MSFEKRLGCVKQVLSKCDWYNGQGLKHRELTDINATHFWIDERGGASFIVDDKGEFLSIPSNMSIEMGIEAYLSGKRSKF